MTRKFIKGQSMFELLVAVFVIGITLTALVSLVVNSIGNTTFSRERTQAAKHTQDAVEWLRAERDNDWGVFKGHGTAGGTPYCLSTLNWTSGPCSESQVIAGTNMRRDLLLVYDSGADPNLVEARITTRWNDSAGLHESRITTYFTNWRTR